MLYHLEEEHHAKLLNTPFLAEFYDTEMLIATFKTDHNIAREIVPRQLAPTKEPLATAFVAKYPEKDFGCVCKEGALFLHCESRGERGLYCLSMPVATTWH
jgi:acetoacetate decarboxylase